MEKTIQDTQEGNSKILSAHVDNIIRQHGAVCLLANNANYRKRV